LYDYRMTEREPILPYNTVHFYKWCEENGVDDRHYGLDKLLVAKLRSPELSKELKLRAEIEASLPLQGSQLVEDPRTAAESWGSQPKIFLAPEGMAYQLEARIDFDDGDEDIDGNKLPPTSSETYTMVGEYLAVETRTVSGKTVGYITVRKRPSKYAVPTLHDGNPDEGGVIRLPSRADPEKDGAYVAFSRLEVGRLEDHRAKSWRVIMVSQKLNLCRMSVRTTRVFMSLILGGTTTSSLTILYLLTNSQYFPQGTL
jgi:hypothetical protein